MKAPMTMMQACRDFFGLKSGQTSMEFGKEYKLLTEDDKKEIKGGLEKQGYTIIGTAAKEPVPA